MIALLGNLWACWNSKASNTACILFPSACVRQNNRSCRKNVNVERISRRHIYQAVVRERFDVVFILSPLLVMRWSPRKPIFYRPGLAQGSWTRCYIH